MTDTVVENVSNDTNVKFARVYKNVSYKVILQLPDGFDVKKGDTVYVQRGGNKIYVSTERLPNTQLLFVRKVQMGNKAMGNMKFIYLPKEYMYLAERKTLKCVVHNCCVEYEL